ncbi:MAG: PIN domain-containing protein [Dehalococcoidia bacterium]
MSETLDANVFLRYITQDNDDQSSRAQRLFEELAAGTRTLVTSEAVVAEVVYVLSSKNLYDLTRTEIRARLRPLLLMRGLTLGAKHACLAAFDLYVEYPRLSFVDALCAARALRDTDGHVVSFDRGFDRVAGVTRREP